MSTEYSNILKRLKVKSNTIQHIQEWEPVDSLNQIYYNQQHKLYKFVNNSKLNANDIYTILLSVDTRKHWCPWIKEIKIVNKPNLSTNVLEMTTFVNQEIKTFTWIEKIIKKDQKVSYIGSNTDNFIICDFEYSNTTVYYHQEYHSVISTLFDNLFNFNNNFIHAWLSQFDQDTIIINQTHLSSSQYELDYTYDQRRHPSASIIEHRLCIELSKMIPDITISIINKSQWSDKLAQLCVHLYSKQDNYLIEVAHPHNLLQHFDNDQSIQIQLIIKKSLNNTFIVNGKEWPVMIMNKGEEEDGESDDIFVDGIEENDTDILDEATVFKADNNKVAIPSSLSNDSDLIHMDQKLLVANKAEIHHLPFIEQQTAMTNQFVKETNKSSSSKVNGVHDKLISTEAKLPSCDPAALQKIYPQFIKYLQLSSTSTLIQSPSKENGYVIIKKLEIPDHPFGGFLSESTWRNCSIWDVKAVLENASARKIWDNTFESTTFLHPLTSTSSIWHTKMKGTWPINPRDYICFHGHYTMGTNRIDLLATSCIGDMFQYKPLPSSHIPGYTRAMIDILGWRLEQIDPQTVSVRQVMVTHFSTWVINYITSRYLVQTCAAVQFAQDYLKDFGAPPSLENLSRAQLVGIKYDHERKSWRCEYHLHPGEQDTKTTTSIIRLDNRKSGYSVVIDPPPSRVLAQKRTYDPYGIWLTIEHDEAFIIPLHGKILTLIKSDKQGNVSGSSDHLEINGALIVIEKDELSIIKNTKEPCIEHDGLKRSERAVEEEKVIKVASEEERLKEALDQLPAPKEYAQAALAFLKSTDEQYGWTVISDNSKTGIQISKKPGLKTTKKPLDNSKTTLFQVFEPYMIYKGTKVIENFSTDEILAVISDLGDVRKIWDDTIETPIDLIRTTKDPNCNIIRQTIKSIFPFKNREYYAIRCLAQEEPLPLSSSSTSMKRTFYVECSLQDFPVIHSKRTQGHFFVSGWILEAIDPYNTTTTNHPIPSTRIIYVATLDLGTSIPSYISNLIANNWFPKKIQAVENYLKTQGPPPFITEPNTMLLFSSNKLYQQEQPRKDIEISWLSTTSSYDHHEHHLKINNCLKITECASSSSSPLQRHRSSAVHKKININIKFLQATFDLRGYPQGYEIQTQLYEIMTTERINVSHKLMLTLCEPPFSNLLDDQKRCIKHTVTVEGQHLSSAMYEFDFLLVPINKEEKHHVLTVSHVLGERKSDEGWNGLMIVNGQQVQTDKDIYLKTINDEDKSPHHVNTKIPEVEATTSLTTMTAQYMGGGVVATALENVSAGVNNIGARMMIPFRAASNSFLSSPVEPQEEKDTSSSSDEEENETRHHHHRFTREERNKINESVSLHEVRMLRRTRDTMRKGILLLFICLGLAIIFALLMLQPILERMVVDESSTVRRLVQLPWFGGWDIQVIAIQRA
ncbi:uncharacterized protein BX663DRAFT_564806 [Cokeromyces recurvatus]|uniref:uncharacterized protein n=1 Tax=Cokeromyces recurvatus TaxID=90255 RepID=UPI002220A4C4|nr:uncharacterized protein BX663DRAFT_564806 [Cokeromyces recurvatus]KAI7898276.1 hypothetical protein BX663DRAFT_564806 [Cokeromyces recurvatus]